MNNPVLHFPLWWYSQSLKWWRRFFKNLLTFLNQQLAVGLMAAMMLVPLWHDVSILGRILSFIFRSIRVVTGSVMMTVTILAMGFWLLVWLLLPPGLIIIFKLPAAIALLIIWLIDIYFQMVKPQNLSVLPEKGEESAYFTPNLKKLVKRVSGDSQLFKKHLLNLPVIRDWLTRIEVAPTSLEQAALPINLTTWQHLAAMVALDWQDAHIAPRHFLAAWLKLLNWRQDQLRAAALWTKNQRRWNKVPFLWDAAYEDRPIGGINRDLTGIPTPTLDQYSTDLTRAAVKKQLPEMFGKEAVLDQLSQVLSQDQQNNALVVGLPGSGKSTLIKSLAQELVRGVKYQKLRFKRLVSLDVTRLSAGADSGELNQRLSKIIAEIKAAENIILFVDEVHNLASINQDAPDTADVFIALEPVLSEGAFQFIGATTTTLYKKFIEPNEAFSRLFRVVSLKEASEAETLSLLEYLAWEKERKNQLLITLPALQRIITLTKRYQHDRVFPDKAVQFLDELVATNITQKKKNVSAANVDQLMEQKTKIPIRAADKKEKEKLLNLEADLHRQVIGQDTAIGAIANAIRRSRTSLKKEDKPIASFLFAGPTGVGKTETAKALAALVFGSENMMIRLDMSEYQHVDSLNRLIGAPPGSKDFVSGGQLTEAVRHQPYSVVLLDEIEKADPKILNLFLQVLDEARLTDNQGKPVDFANTIIIATTNVGTKAISVSKEKQVETVGKTSLEEHFPPEFLNRFTDLIVFAPLTLPQTKAVVKLKLNRLVRDLKKQEVEVSFADDVVDYLAQVGYSPKWGGRQLDRVIQEKVANLVSRKLLTETVTPNQLFSFKAADLQS